MREEKWQGKSEVVQRRETKREKNMEREREEEERRMERDKGE